MFKVVGIALAVLLILFQFFGTSGLLVVISVAVVLLALIYWNQNKILYMPRIPETTLSPSGNPFGYKHPSQQGLDTEDVTIVTLDNIVLRGWLIKKEGSQRLIVYFHENAGNIGFRIPFMKNIIQRTNSDVLLVAYRGYSDSEGTPTEKGLQRDGQAILQWAINYKNKISSEGKPKDLYLLGRSLGGAVTIYISTKQAYKKEISGLVLQNTFTSISDMVQALFPVLSYVKFLQTNFWRSIERVPLIEQPVLFIRSMRDEIVPTAQMAELIKNANGCKFKVQYQIKNGTHNMAWEYEPQTYFGQYLNFFKEIEGSISD